MALTSTSTFTDAYAQLNDNHRWWESAAKAGDWYEAYLWLETNRPAFSMRQNSQVNFRNLEATAIEVRKKLSATDSTVNRSSFAAAKARPA